MASSLSFLFVMLIITCKLTNQSDLCSDAIRHTNCHLLPPDDQCGLSASDIAPRIILGTNASPGELPWMVMLLLKKNGRWVSNCGGTVISRKYVATAAHCFKAIATYRVRVFSSNGYSDIPVEKIKVHKRYGLPHRRNDIALLRLRDAVHLDAFTSPICLPISSMVDSGVLYQKTVVAAGFGVHLQTKMAEHYPDGLQKVSLRMMPHKQCKESYYMNSGFRISSKMLCTSNKGGKDTCNGDSGGPLMAALEGQYYLIGIISFGDVQCGVGLPNVHTRVSKYLEWILDNMEP